MVNLPEVKGMIESLVGPKPRFDHSAIHKKPANSDSAQILHADAEIDMRENHFDIQLSFFIHDTPKQMGGTRFLPGSHYRRVHESQLCRYQHIKGMYQVECKAGTVVAWHHNLWHGAQPNFTDQMRYMFKVRLNPMVKQQLLWNTDGLADAKLEETLFATQPWYGQENRIEQFNRIRFWRFLTDNPQYDHADWYTRVENIPE
jgi:ectoine hydroxylase-related dioxygenase (phytanoyl-CoA dioxygenase family)